MAVGVSPLHAQLVADGATNTLSNVTNNITSDVTLGTNGSFNRLVVGNVGPARFYRLVKP